MKIFEGSAQSGRDPAGSSARSALSPKRSDACGTIADQLFAWRDGLLGSPRFQRWASAFPLTRPIARTQARALFDVCAGFVYSQILFACVQLRLFEILSDGPKTIEDLSIRLALSPAATERLLEAAVSLGLAARRGKSRYGLGVSGAAILGNPGVAEMVEHHALLYADLADPAALLRGELNETKLSRFWAYPRAESAAALKSDEVGPYSALMAASQAFVAHDILAAWRFKQHRHLLDVGGGEGAFLATVAAAAPHLRLTLFDLPPIAVKARIKFDAVGLSARADAVGGDFFKDPLPQGADVVSLNRILHDHDDARVLVLLRAVRDILPPDGALLVAEPMADAPGAEPVGAAYFGFYLLAMGSGRPRTAEQLTHLLKMAGFDAVRKVPTRRPLMTGLLVARPRKGGSRS
ncbi:acetylserotonin O-methyltransferase [Methylocapsa palsarum]|uniref:Demethylspheroidene O-methyltransferase n=1 Tax=Methylocapsa palsarum TaxID=1612308 RepID=A0A1I4BBY1_9HYPH|nr:acetylserotonin O-methyltransferase [Methylocapsa palsarum]SFK66275.1 demethylspheroidene O-methyltransferase [Methylocapsa palsarum]